MGSRETCCKDFFMQMKMEGGGVKPDFLFMRFRGLFLVAAVVCVCMCVCVSDSNRRAT